MDWKLEPQTAHINSVDIAVLRARLQKMTDDELIKFGKLMHGLVYPLTRGFDGKPTKSAFRTQLLEARSEWRRRHPKT